MTFFYVKALHIIFVVTWFSGLFYITRLFIYNREAQDRPEPERSLFQKQYNLMIKRLWFGITWPSAVLTLIFGSWMLYLYGSLPLWLMIKLLFVVLLYLYHFSLHALYKQQKKGIFKYSSQQLRIWNEVATVFLFAIVFLVVVKQGISLVYGLLGLVLFVLVLMLAIRLYKTIRNKK
jgi:putative membrane protein